MREYSVLEASRPAAIRECSQSGVKRTLLPTAGTARFLAHDLDRFDRLQMRKLPVRNFLHERQRRCLSVEVLQHEERFLPDAVVADETFAVPTVLHIRQRAARRTEVCEYPRRGAAPLRHLLQHREGLTIEIFLVLLAETRAAVRVQSLQGVGAELADHHRFFVAERPADLRQRSGRPSYQPMYSLKLNRSM